MPTTPCGPGCTPEGHCAPCHRPWRCKVHGKPASGNGGEGRKVEAPAAGMTVEVAPEPPAAAVVERPAAALARVEEAPGPLARLAPMRVEEAKEAFSNYQALEGAILEDDDYIYFVRADVYWVGNRGDERKSAKCETFTVRAAAEARAGLYRTAPGKVTRDRVDPLSVVVEARKKKSAFRKMSKAAGLSVPGLDENGKPPTPVVTTEAVGPFLVRKTIAPGFASTVYMTLKELAIIKAEVQVLLTEPNGRAAWQTGSCGIDEKKDGASGFNHPGHDIEGTAVTRAISRCTSDLIGWGEVSPIDEAPLPEDDLERDRRADAAEAPAEAKPTPRGIPESAPAPSVPPAAAAPPRVVPSRSRVVAPATGPPPSPAAAVAHPAASEGQAAPSGELTPQASAAEKNRLLTALMRLANQPDMGKALDAVTAWRTAERQAVGRLLPEDRAEVVFEARTTTRTLLLLRIGQAQTVFELRGSANKRKAAIDYARTGSDGLAWHAEWMVAYTDRMAQLERAASPPGTAPPDDDVPPPDDRDAPPPPDAGENEAPPRVPRPPQTDLFRGGPR